MKTSKFLTALAMLGMVACNNVSDDVISHGSALSIKVGTQTKALVTETTLPDAAQIGTFLHNSEGALYDDLPYGNVKFTASGTGALQSWSPDTDVILSATQGTLYGYYPYSASATDLSAVAVEAASQTDYMWATPVSGLDNKNNSAMLTMNHALTAVRLKVVRGDYAGTGLVTAASVQSNALATAATMNIADGTLASVTGAGEVIAPALSQFTLSASEQAVEFIAVPVDGASEALTIEMVVDGQTLVVEAPATDYPQAAIAEYGVTVNGTGLALTQVTVAPWTETSKGNLGISEVKPAQEIDLTKATNGETANCWIISEGGATYSFPTVKGNSSESVGTVASAKVVWESYGTTETINVGDLVSEAVYEDGKIKVTTTGKNGNALVAACDASGNILWSWHLWITDDTIQEHTYANGAGVAMDRNLGALSATPGDVGALGLLYQWGRKDPFLASASISADTEPVVAGTAINAASGYSLALSIANPTNFYSFGKGTFPSDDSWGDTKTIYDPCPVGWKVPGKDFWINALPEEPEENEYWDNTNKGMLLPASISGAESWYPAAGYREHDTEIFETSDFGSYWTSTFEVDEDPDYGDPDYDEASDAYFMEFDISTIYPEGGMDKTSGYSVRAVRE